MNTVLIIEDEQKIADLLADYLSASGLDPVIVDDGDLAMNAFNANSPSCVLLDLMLPNKDGLEICKEIREISTTPIIMLTAKVEELDRILGLELGADDYVCKPFSPREVVARVKAQIRRLDMTSHSNRGEPDRYEIDRARMQVKIKGARVELTAIEFELFSLFSAEPERVFSRQQLMNKIYVDNRIVSERTIDSHIKKLRQKIQSAIGDDANWLHSVYGVGYRFSVMELEA